MKLELRRQFPDYQSFLTTRKGECKGRVYPLTLITLVRKTGEPATLVRDMPDIDLALGPAQGRLQLIRVPHSPTNVWWLVNVYQHTAGCAAGQNRLWAVTLKILQWLEEQGGMVLLGGDFNACLRMVFVATMRAPAEASTPTLAEPTSYIGRR